MLEHLIEETLMRRCIRIVMAFVQKKHVTVHEDRQSKINKQIGDCEMSSFTSMTGLHLEINLVLDDRWCLRSVICEFAADRSRSPI